MSDPEDHDERRDDTETDDGTESDDGTEPLADLADEVGVETSDDDSLADLADDTPLGGVDPETVDVTAPSDTADEVDVFELVDDAEGEIDGDAVVTPDETDGDEVDAPLSELAEAVAATEPLDDSPFEQVETTDLDPAEAWQRLEDDEQFEQPGSEIDAEPVEDPATAAPEHVVDKRQYCQQCPHLSTPPDVACGHEGTEIVEVTDADHFRVRACPVIGEDGPNFDAVDEE